MNVRLAFMHLIQSNAIRLNRFHCIECCYRFPNRMRSEICQVICIKLNARRCTHNKTRRRREKMIECARLKSKSRKILEQIREVERRKKNNKFVNESN